MIALVAKNGELTTVAGPMNNIVAQFGSHGLVWINTERWAS